MSTVYRMPQGDWGACCSRCMTVTDGLYDEQAALAWLATHHDGQEEPSASPKKD